jgi:hypothetical protein
MQWIDDCQKRYASDRAWAQLVDMFEMFIQQAQYTPSEIRQAAIHAAVRHELRSVRPIWLNPESDRLEWLEPPRRRL